MRRHLRWSGVPSALLRHPARSLQAWLKKAAPRHCCPSHGPSVAPKPHAGVASGEVQDRNSGIQKKFGKCPNCLILLCSPPKLNVSGSQQAWLGSASSLVAVLLPGYRKISKLVQLFSYFWIEKNPPEISEQRETTSWQRWEAAGRQAAPAGLLQKRPLRLLPLVPIPQRPGTAREGPSAPPLHTLPALQCSGLGAGCWGAGTGEQRRPEPGRCLERERSSGQAGNSPPAGAIQALLQHQPKHRE